MTVVGEKLAVPDNGWKRYDDTDSNIVYENFTLSTVASAYNSTTTFNPVGSNQGVIKFKFKGTSLRIISPNHPTVRTSNAEIYIDNVLENFRTNYINDYSVLSYEKTGLKDRVHDVIIKNFTVTDSSYAPFGLDAIDINEDGEIKSYDTEIYIKRSIIKKENEFYSINQKSQSLIPVMTSNTAPSGVVSASSSYQNATAPYKAVNNVKGDYWQATNTSVSDWLNYEFPTEVKANSYDLLGRIGLLATYPKNFELQASNDKINWTVLDKQVDVTDWVDGEIKTYVFKNDKTYKNYRVYITGSVGNNLYYTLSVFQLNLNESTLIKLPEISVNNFENYGFRDAIDTSHEFNKIDYVTNESIKNEVTGLIEFNLKRKPLSIKFK